MKRTFSDRPNWSRVINKRFKLEYIENEDYSGFISIIYIDEVKEPLLIRCGGEDLCLVDNGYIWTQHFPNDENYALTTIFNKEHEVVEWYFDICKGNKTNGKGMPYYDDLYLDVVVLPSSVVVLLDEDELKDALKTKEITKEEYDLAYFEAKKLMGDIENDKNELLKKSNFYLENMLLLPSR